MRLQKRTRKENVKDALLDFGGWAESKKKGRERWRERDGEEVRKHEEGGTKTGMFSSFFATVFSVFLLENSAN